MIRKIIFTLILLALLGFQSIFIIAFGGYQEKDMAAISINLWQTFNISIPTYTLLIFAMVKSPFVWVMTIIELILGIFLIFWQQYRYSALWLILVAIITVALYWAVYSPRMLISVSSSLQ